MYAALMLPILDYNINRSVVMSALVYQWPEKLGQRVGEEHSRRDRRLEPPQHCRRLQHEEEERRATQTADIL